MKVFLAAPFTQMIDPRTKTIRSDFRSWLEDIIRALTGAGFDVTSAHVREDWGYNLQPSDEALENDLRSVRECDVVAAILAYPGEAASPGVLTEVGMAIASDKPILLFVPSELGDLPYMQRNWRGSGFPRRESIRFEAKTQHNVKAVLVDLLEELESDLLASSSSAKRRRPR